MEDILFKTEKCVFSYRVAGVCLQNGRILLQKPSNDTAYAVPGGHVSFDETQKEALIREFREEIGADITVGKLLWIGELFFPWGNRTCHQICLYYAVKITDASILRTEQFIGREAHQNFEMKFYWVPLDQLAHLEVYPTKIYQLISNTTGGVAHFIYRENTNQKSEIIVS